MLMRPRALPVRLVFVLPILLLLVGMLLQGAASTPPADVGQFPAIQARSLDGAHPNLPAEFSGQLNLVIVSFAREQQHEVDSWIPAARQIESAHAKFRYYELPTMSRENMLYRWWFDEALRSNTTDKNLRSRILTAYVNKRAFRKSLHIANEKQAVAILVDPKGQVYWRADGPYKEQDMAAILAVLAANGA
jgi:ATP10 protein